MILKIKKAPLLKMNPANNETLKVSKPIFDEKVKKFGLCLYQVNDHPYWSSLMLKHPEELALAGDNDVKKWLTAGGEKFRQVTESEPEPEPKKVQGK